mgnify:CR=1 FL=1
MTDTTLLSLTSMLHMCGLRQCVCELWVRIPVRQQVAEVQLIVFQAVCVVVCFKGHVVVIVCVRATM